jgi:hypothetical protein
MWDYPANTVQAKRDIERATHANNYRAVERATPRRSRPLTQHSGTSAVVAVSPDGSLLGASLTLVQLCAYGPRLSSGIMRWAYGVSGHMTHGPPFR